MHALKESVWDALPSIQLRKTRSERLSRKVIEALSGTLQTLIDPFTDHVALEFREHDTQVVLTVGVLQAGSKDMLFRMRL